MKNRFFLLFVFASSIMISCNEQKAKSTDPIVYALANDPELEKAKQDAFAKLDYFIKSFQENSNDTIFQYSVKADFTDNQEHEHMWVLINKIENNKFIGELGNKPEIVKNVKIGSLITITRDQIEDWIITDSRTNSWEGGYSIIVLLKRQE